MMIEDEARKQGVSVTHIVRDQNKSSWPNGARVITDDNNNRKILVHTAMPPNPRFQKRYSRYEYGSLALLEESLASGAEFIFLSTLSITPTNSSRYTRHKLRMEKLILERGGSVVRLGIVKSELPNSSFQKIRRLVLRFPIDFLSEVSSVYFVTESADISKWIKSVNLDGKIYDLPQACANPVRYSLQEAMEIDGIYLRRPSPPIRFLFTYLGKALSRIDNPLTDPLKNLRAGMSWCCGG